MKLLSDQEIKKKVVDSKRPFKCNKKRREYQNWFQPQLLPPNLARMKRYGITKTTLMFLQSPYKSTCIFSPYVRLTSEQCGSGLLGMLKEIYIQVAECETTKKRSQIKRD